MMEWLISSPWETESKRRGDALGLGNIAEEFAELLAPNLSNRTRDARWISILSWILCVSEKAPWQNKIKENTKGSDVSKSRYQWIQPLELLWIHRTNYLKRGETKGLQLPGIRTIKQYSLKKTTSSNLLFGFTKEQLTRYRFTGIYGSYRTAFRFLPGLTIDSDGWNPDKCAIALAKIVSEKIGFEMRSRYTNKSKPETLWFNQWKNRLGSKSKTLNSTYLPIKEDVLKSLPKDERLILEKILFGEDNNGVIRRAVVELLNKSKGKNHNALCEELSCSPKFHGLEKLALFSSLTDDAFEILLTVWNLFKSPHTNSAPSITLANALKNKDLCLKLDNAKKTGEKWNKEKDLGKRINLCDKLAKALTVESRVDRLNSIITFHYENCGGLPWMRLKGEDIYPLVTPNQSGKTRYRFRLWQLCRLGIQCGITNKMPDGLVPEETEYNSDELEDVEEN